MNKIALEKLIAGRAKIENPDNWCTKTYSVDINDKFVGSSSEEAVKWCGLGAINSFCDFHNEPEIEIYNYASSCLRVSAKKLFDTSLIDVNDRIGHKAVLEVFDDAITELKRNMKTLTFPIKAFQIICHYSERVFSVEVYQLELTSQLPNGNFRYKTVRQVLANPPRKVDLYTGDNYEIELGPNLCFDYYSVGKRILAEVERANTEFSATIKEIRAEQTNLIEKLAKLSDKLNSLEKVSTQLTEIKVPTDREFYEEEYNSKLKRT